MSNLSVDEFKVGVANLLKALPSGVLRDSFLLTIPCDQRPWLDTGIDLAAGEQFTTFAHGKTLLKGMELCFSANFQLWFRIGAEGEIFRGTRDSHSFSADRPGRLYLSSYFPGEWANKTGELSTPDQVYQLASGVFTVVLLRWLDSAMAGLRSLAEQGEVDGIVASELQRLQALDPAPAGWEYLWSVGPAEIYSPIQIQHKAGINCHTHDNVGLLQKRVELPLQTDSRLHWAWKIDSLPSVQREDKLMTHDYLSIAVEFDNGQDITYFWSAQLPPETGFRCPIPTWAGRETHVVVRSGTADLGYWFNEERNLFQDYRRYIGGELPDKIVKVWLIAVSFFQHGLGECQYAEIRLVQGGEEFAVL